MAKAKVAQGMAVEVPQAGVAAPDVRGQVDKLLTDLAEAQRLLTEEALARKAAETQSAHLRAEVERGRRTAAVGDGACLRLPIKPIGSLRELPLDMASSYPFRTRRADIPLSRERMLKLAAIAFHCKERKLTVTRPRPSAAPGGQEVLIQKPSDALLFVLDQIVLAG